MFGGQSDKLRSGHLVYTTMRAIIKLPFNALARRNLLKDELNCGWGLQSRDPVQYHLWD